MKILVSKLTLLIVMLSLNSICHAQGVPEPSIKKGSVIVYEVKERSTYIYTITVTKFSEADGIELKWGTNEKSGRNGTTTMAFANLTDATKLLLKPVAGKEKLGEDHIRIFFTNNIVTNLVGNKNVDIEIDGKVNTFLYLATKDERADIEYNGSKSSVDYTSGDAGDVGIGFCTIGDYQLIHTFRSKDISFTLRSITTK